MKTASLRVRISRELNMKKIAVYVAFFLISPESIRMFLFLGWAQLSYLLWFAFSTYVVEHHLCSVSEAIGLLENSWNYCKFIGFRQN